MASNKANVLSFEAESNGSIFSLRASKRRTPVAELLKTISEDETIESEEELHHLFGSINVTSLQENILYYISGFIIRKIIHKIDCQQCSASLVIPVSSTDHFYATMPYECSFPYEQRWIDSSIIWSFQSCKGAMRKIFQNEYH
eukprot:gene17068-8586_t